MALTKPLLHFQERDAMIEKYFWLVRQIAAKLMRRLNHADFNDLVSDGVFGLMRAIEQYDPARGAKFETYATPVIRGTMLNGLRSMDWVPERKRIKTRELQRAMDRFQIIHGREGTENELAAELQISAKEVYELIADLGTSYLLSLDQPVSAANTEDERAMIDTLEDPNTREPAAEFQLEEERKTLRNTLDRLEERERMLVTLHYFEAKSFEEISLLMNISKQRFSQLHAKAIRKLREALQAGSTQPIGLLLEGVFLE